MLKFIELLGAAFMYVFRIKETKVPPPDADLKPTQGRNFINYDAHDPDMFLDRREEMGVIPDDETVIGNSVQS